MGHLKRNFTVLQSKILQFGLRMFTTKLSVIHNCVQTLRE